jgi:HEAT repeat protein
MDAAARFGVSRLRLATCLMSGAAMRFAFGWTQSDDGSDYFGCGLNVAHSNHVSPATDTNINALDHIVWDMDDAEMLDFLGRQIEAPAYRYGQFAHRFGKLHGALAALRPHIIDQFLAKAAPQQTATLDWLMIVRATDRFDPQAIAFAKSTTTATEALRLLVLIDTLRPGTCPADALAKAFEYDAIPDESGLIYLHDRHPHKLPAYLSACLAEVGKMTELSGHNLRASYGALARDWNHDARQAALDLAKAPLVPTNSYSSGKSSLQGIALQGMLEADPPPPGEDLRSYLAVTLESIENAPFDSRTKLEFRQFIYHAITAHHPEPFTEKLWSLLNDKSKILRELAIQGLAQLPADQILQPAIHLLGAKKSDVRISSAELLGKIANPAAIVPLLSVLESETTDAVRAALHQAVKDCGGSVPETAFDLNAFLAQHSKGLKLPSCSWLDISNLPPLTTTDGTPLPEQAITLLIAKQSKHKTLDAAPDIVPILAHIDRTTSAPFAAALVEGFLNSDQAAADRWALALGGLLGDKRIITLLLPRIKGWCENSRHKLAEYAAQAISLLPGNEPLMVLDTLSNRYRSKFKNVGKACADAFNAAATARGITADELGDMVVPDFGFDAEGIRRFEWQGGGVSAELCGFQTQLVRSGNGKVMEVPACECF